MTSGDVRLSSDRFVIHHEVGRGGVGVVYQARDRLTGQTVALKVIAVTGVDAGEEERFQREGRLLASIVHPNIVRVIAFGQLDQGQPFIAMEWLDGEDLARALTRPPLPLAKILKLSAEVASALVAAHAAGIVHRDVKPSNIFVLSWADDAPPPSVKLVDFGVAITGDPRVTRTGVIVGTPAYMAPEQARGDVEVDARADLYALGATMFELLTGRPPHIGPTPIAILARLVTTSAPRLSDVVHDVPPALDDLLFRLLATHPMDRPASAAGVKEEILDILRDIGDFGGRPLARTGQRAPASVEASSHGTAGIGGSRFITTLVATSMPKGPSRARLLTQLRARGAEATELGGDAVVAHLGVRKAVGDEAVRAIELGLRIAKAEGKVGVATGRSRVDGARPTGDVVDRAAALSRDAPKGALLADTMTTEMSRGRFELQLRADGSAVVGEPVAGRRDGAGGVPFFGREAELTQVLESFERSVEDKTPVIATVCGVPGLGKTRLRREVLSRIGARPSGARVVVVRCAMFAKGYPFGVAADVIRHLAGVIQAVSLEQALAMIDLVLPEGEEVRLSSVARDVIARVIANEPWSGMGDARSARDALWLGLTDIVLANARTAPFVVCVEDAQWADPDSLGWLDHVLGRAANTSLWMLVTARPSIWRDHPGRFEGRDHLRIELRPLAKKTVRAIATAMLGDKAADEAGQELVDAISNQAAGSPLFAEELARLALRGQDATSAPTLEAALQVHLDALEDSVRDATIRMSVFGVVVWDAGLAALGVADPQKVLRELAAADIVIEQASSRFAGTREWAFKHALMREVAYASFGDDALREAHLAAGRFLARVGDDPVAIARHLELGGDATAAAVYLEKGARRALAAHALSDAVSMAERSLAFAVDKPSEFARAQLLEEAWSRLDARAAEREVAVQAMETAVYDAATELRARGARLRYEDASGGQPGTTDGLDEVRRAARELGLEDEETRAAAVQATRLAYGGELARAEEIARELLELADRKDIAGARIDAWQILAVVSQTRGEVGAALRARQEAVRAASESGSKGREATLLINVGFALTTLGAKDEARWVIDRGISLAQAIGSPGTERHGKMILLGWAATFGGGAALESALSEPRRLADSSLEGGWVPHDRATLGVLFYRGEELLRQKPNAEGDACVLLRAAAQGYKATKMLDVLPAALGLWAEAERRCGRPEAALALAIEAAELLDSGAPSLLSESPVFVALHDALEDLGDAAGARCAIERGLPHLITRVRTLSGTPYSRSFLHEITSNARLIAAAKGYGLAVDELVV